jgi:L-gulono-1,4-lactone dehydrogenase
MWSNWAGDQRCSPAEVVRPRGVDEVVAAVANGPVKVAGSGHSFSDCALSDHRLLDLGALDSVEMDAGRARVGAGVTIRALNAALADAGLALANLGDIDAQTVAGAVSTGTHGTGLGLPSLSGQVEAVEMVLADGSVRSFTRDDEEFGAVRCGLGALGVITSVTMGCVPAFTLHQTLEVVAIEELLASLPERLAAEHFEFFVFPHADRAIAKTRRRTDAPAKPRSRAGEWLHDIALENHFLHGVLAYGRRVPRHVPALNRMVTRLGGGPDRYDASARIFASPRLFRFTEAEHAVEATHAVDAIQAVLAVARRHRLGMPIEVRWVGADEPWLSMAHGRDTCFVAVHGIRDTPWPAYFDDVTEALEPFTPRPHWGKRSTLTAAQLAPRYPRWDDFRRVRDRLDPERRFANAFTQRMLGE